MSARCVELIIAEEARGAGIELDPHRCVVAVYDKKGELIAQQDSQAPTWIPGHFGRSPGAFRLSMGTVYEFRGGTSRIRTQDGQPPDGGRSVAMAIAPVVRLTGSEIADGLAERDQLRVRHQAALQDLKAVESVVDDLKTWIDKHASKRMRKKFWSRGQDAALSKV